MLNMNLKTMREAKGLTQEELAIRLNVVRQTISKWEKGLSVPDADLLIKIADILGTTVGTLLGAAIEDEAEVNILAEQLSRINEQLAIRNNRSRRIWKIIGIVLISIAVFNVLLILLSVVSFKSFRDTAKTETMEGNQIIQSNAAD
jgi:putative transcriptional regulator